MSYSENQSVRIPYSGSVSTTYPASEHGGTKTVHYSGYVDVGVNVYVDTDPFDASIDGTNQALDVVAGAIAATEVAQVAQIRKAAEDISNTAIHGFFQVAANELSSQVSEFSSSMSSTVGLLAEQGRQISHIHDQMNGDYRNIKGRYQRIFNELDRELDRRIKELDRPAFQVSTHGMREVVFEPVEDSATMILTQASDSSTTPLKLSCATTKSNVSDTLSRLGDVCTYLTEYANEIEGIATPENGEGYVYMPVVYTMQQDIATDRQRIVVHAPEWEDGGQVTQRVIATVANTNESEWRQPTPEDKEALDREFMRCLESYAAAQGGAGVGVDQERVCRQILDMYRQTNTQTAYGHEGQR